MSTNFILLRVHAMNFFVKSKKWISSLFCPLLLLLSACEAPKQQNLNQVHSLKAPQQPKNLPRPEPELPQLPRKDPNQQMMVALLLPFSGGGQEVGKSIMDAAKLALFDLKANNITLRPYDTGSEPHQVIRQAESAIRDGAEVFLGPVFFPSVKSITNLAQQANIPVLSFSNTPEIATHGIYPLGFNPGEQTRAILDYVKEQGIRKIAILSPNTRYAELSVSSLKQHAGKAIITREVVYDRSTQNFDESVRSLLGVAAGFTPNPKESMDALFVPDRGEKLAKILESLQHYGVDLTSLKVFGPDSLKDADAAKYPLLKGVLFAGPDSTEREKFRKRFMDTYRYDPTEIATISYDLIALFASLSQDGYKISNEALTQENGFNGIDGPFKMNKYGQVERRYAIFQVDQGGGRIIQPPSRVF